MGETKSRITQLIAGKNQSEQFNIIMNDSKRVMENYNGVLHATNSLDSKYQQHLESTEAKMNKLKATSEKLWMSFIHSSTINTAVGALTHLVGALNQMIQAGLGTKLAIAGLGATTFLVTKHFLGFIKLISYAGKDVTIFQGIIYLLTGAETTCLTATEALKIGFLGLKGALTALFATPAGLIFVGLSIAVGVATHAIYKHIKKQQELKAKNEELTKSYKDLTTAMKNNDTAGMQSGVERLKKEQKNLQDLIKEQKNLQEQLKKTPTNLYNSDQKMDLKVKLEETNKSIKEQIELLKKSGHHINETTGAIQELSQAENQIKTNEFFEHVQEMTEGQIKYRKEIVALWKEYQTLSAIENKNASQKQQLSNVVDDLKRYMKDLTVETDSNGNATIKNTELVGKQIDMLDSENVSINDLIDVKIEHARQTQICQGNMTNCVYAEVGKRIQAYQDEVNALNGLKSLYASSQWGKFDDSISKQFGLQSFGQQTDSNISKLQNEIKALKDKEKNWNDNVSKLKNNFKIPSAPKHDNYMPSASSKPHKSRSSKKKSHKTKTETKYKFDGQAESVYDGIIKTINKSLEQTDSSIEGITQRISNLQSLESKSNYAEIIDKENAKLDQQKIKVNKLQSAQSQASSMLKNIGNEFSKNWSWMRGKDLSKLRDVDFDKLYNDHYGKEISLGVGDNGKAWKEKYEKGAKLFQELRRQYENARELSEKSAQDELKMEQEINATIKERVEIQKASYDEQLRLEQKQIDLAQANLDVFNIYEKENVDYIKKAQLTGQLIGQQKSYLVQMIGIRNEITRQRNALQENTLEWNLLNSLLDEYEGKINESNKNLQQTLET
ncbi:hypothetical protein G8V07_15220, partial [Clostridium botulinum D/C]|nr:hypothetical protein [Clostridium botulinum D/C]MCD3325068.1 hypothetical protein [Clostridium botulinum D/C]